MTDLDVADDLRRTVERACAGLSELSEEAATRRPAPGKWAPIEILGHLIDSASNNHRRFIRARFQDDLRFEGYPQDDWVEAQAYRSAPWADVLTLWRAFNLHLAHVMEATPRSDLDRPRPDHDLDRIAWEPVPPEEPATLGYFMRDYVGHLKHHLRQISPALADPPRRQRPDGPLRAR